METPESGISFAQFILSLGTTAAVHFGDLPDPTTGERGETDLAAAAQMIELIGMLQEKTRGNLTNEEATVLKNTLSNLQMAFVEVSQQTREGKGSFAPQSEAETPEPAAAPSAEKTDDPAAPAQAEPESRKKFTKSYGA